VDDVTLLKRSLADASRIIDGIGPDQFGAPTPCPDFTVQQLLDHLVLGDGVYAVALGGAAELPDGGWHGVAPLLEAGAEMPGDPDAPITMRHGTFSRAAVIRMALLETAVHAADLARATGQQLGDDAVYEAVFGLIPDQFRMAGVLSPAVPCAEDAPLLDRVLAFAGRAID
jgi:uncharacterized protein (TIGR03086 family)